MINFIGSWVALVTPMYKTGEVDYQSLEALIVHQMNHNSSGILLLGSTGEAPTIEMDEREKIVRSTRSILNNNMPLMVGVGSNATQQSVRYAVQAQKCGAQSLLIQNPYYNKPTDEGIYQHIKSVHDACQLPLVLYNVPSRTGYDMPNDLIKKLSLLPRVKALKDATADLTRVKQLKEMCDLFLLSGDDGTTADFLKSGGDGMISVTANVLPLELSQIYDLKCKEDYTAMHQVAQKLDKLNTFLFTETNPIPVKWLLAEMNLISSDTLRLPLTVLSKEKQSFGMEILRRDLAECRDLL